MGKEVFSFALSLTPRATEGSAYADTSRSDGRLKLSLSCIQVVYLHKVFMSLLVSVRTERPVHHLLHMALGDLGQDSFVDFFSSRTSATTSRRPKQL